MRRTAGPLVVTVMIVAALALMAGCTGTPSENALVGRWGSTAAAQPGVTIRNDGTFSGTDGCNRLSGTGTIDGNTITFGSMTISLMACLDVDQWLNRAATGTAAGSTMTIYDKSGSTIGTLDKSR